MLFNSVVFFWFFLAVWSVARVLPFRWRLQNCFLIAAGYLFYGWWDWRFLGLLALSTLIDYTAGLALARATGERARRAILGTAIGANLVILGFFKYFNFFAGSLKGVLAFAGMKADFPTLNVVLPVGISFYTFQSMAYAIDVYRRKVDAVRNLADYALYVAFFPQLMAGPIERAGHMIPQMSRPRTADASRLAEGGFLVLAGVFKKVCIADNLAPLVQAGFSPWPTQGAAGTLIAIAAFTLQIYGDFSGYSDMARGLARMLGFDVMRNFEVPYASHTPSEFWRRWHISLSTWLRDYLYIPLGGNRRGGLRQAGNLMATMLLGGLWHGANWTFVLWGGYHGTLLVAQRALERVGIAFVPEKAGRASRAASVAMMLALTSFGWLLFRAKSLHQVGALLSRIATRPWSGAFGHGSTAAAALVPLALWGGCMVLIDCWSLLAGEEVFLRRWRLPAQVAVVAALYYGIVFFGSMERNEFIYFQF